MKLRLRNRENMTNKTLIIAEAGVNHNGDIHLAKKMIEAAALAGADIVKFQTFSAERQVTRSASKAIYQTQSTDECESQFEMLRRLELTDEAHQELMKHCSLHKIKFLSTGFDIESINLLVNLGVDIFKIPSVFFHTHKQNNLPYLKEASIVSHRIST